MDTRTLHDHPWDALVSGAPGAAAEATVAVAEAVTTGTGAAVLEEARSGFQVLSLEQYAASHTRSVHQTHER